MENTAYTDEQYQQLLLLYAQELGKQAVQTQAQAQTVPTTASVPVSNATPQTHSSSAPASGFSYPKQIWNAMNSKQCCYIEDNLCAPEKEEYQAYGGKLQPMNLHSRYSKFRLAIFDYAASKNVFINIEPEHIEDIKIKTLFANYYLYSNSQQNTGEKIPEAYTYKLKRGTATIKGKTPAQAIFEDINNVVALQKHYEFLQDNVDKYPSNKTEMAIIQQALQLYSEGKLSQDMMDSQATPQTELYSVVKIPSADKDNTGYAKYVSAKIYYTSGNFPFTIEIANGKCIPVHKGDVTFAQSGSIKDLVKYEFHLSSAQWNDAVRKMAIQLSDFESEIRLAQRKIAIDAARTNYKGNR